MKCGDLVPVQGRINFLLWYLLVGAQVGLASLWGGPPDPLLDEVKWPVRGTGPTGLTYLDPLLPPPCVESQANT